MSNANFTYIRLNDLHNELHESVYVINNTAHAKNMDEGIIFLSISVNNEGERPLIIPMTWVPFDLSSQIPKEALLKSTVFRVAINKQAIKLIPTEEAEAFLEDNEEARAESDRVTADLLNNNNFKDEDKNKDGRSLIDKLKDSAEEVRDAVRDDINFKLQEILETEDTTEQEMYSLIKNLDQQRKLTKADYEFILESKNAPAKVKAYITNKST